jgi:hypothetical protein
MKRRCNLCLRNVDHKRTDKWDIPDKGFTVTLCYDCQTVITRVVEK